jgi:hypothetical protein
MEMIFRSVHIRRLVLFISMALQIVFSNIESADFPQNLRKAAIPGILDHPSVQNFGLRCVDQVGDGNRGKGLIATRHFRPGDLLLKVASPNHWLQHYPVVICALSGGTVCLGFVFGRGYAHDPLPFQVTNIFCDTAALFDALAMY